MISFYNVCKSFKKDTVLKNLTFKIENGDFVIIEGHNGSGKTTIINLLLNLIDLDLNSGEIENDFKSISYYPDRFNLPSLIKSSDFIYMYFDGLKSKVEISNFLEKYNLENKFICNLSKGNMLKIIIIKTLLEDSELYIFDEPLNGLDDLSKEVFLNDLKEKVEKKKTVIVVTHDKEFFKSSANKIITIGG